MNKIIIAITIIIVAVLGWYLFTNRGDGTLPPPQTLPPVGEPIPTPEEGETIVSPGLPPNEGTDTETIQSVIVEVTYTKDGFEPRETKINKGDTVTFFNESGGAMWVASNPHPIHTDYPAFDQRHSDTTYSFTFTEPGIYHYHNHLSPKRGGVVIVE